MNDLDWIQDAALALRSDIDVELEHQPGQADLADVLARARVIDAGAVPEELGVFSDNSESWTGGDQPLDPELAVFAAALRAEVEEDVEDRAMQPAIAPAGRASMRQSWGAWVALAAAVIAVIGLASMGPGDEHRQLEDAPASMASKSLQDIAENGAWTQAAQSRAVVRERRAPPETTTPLPVEEIEPLAEPVPGPTEAGRTWKRARPKRRSLDALEADAMAAWKAGNLSRAESLLRTIIRRAGRGTKAELAYGDLFALEKQRAGATKQAQIWRQYLRRFPNGRYADDARAGLCMRTSGEAASACWSDYLTKHPRGAHVKRARRATP